MSLELKDFRCKVTARTDAVLEAHNRAAGKDKSEIAREILDAWAEEQIRLHTVLGQLLASEGIEGNPSARGGKMRDTRG